MQNSSALQRATECCSRVSTRSEPVICDHTHLRSAQTKRHVVRAPTHRRTGRWQCQRLVTHMGIRWIEDFEAQAGLQEEAQRELFELLHNPTFCSQVAEQSGNTGGEMEFTEMIFTPVPWSPATPKGMPQEIQEYHDNPSYATINVPPNFMFKAKILKPSRLCALYKIKGM